ncbi:MAG: hypothetical protein WCO33_00970 [bacterium]
MQENNQKFKIESYTSIEEVYENNTPRWKELTDKDLVIFDLDGVLLMWPFSIHTFLFRIRETKLRAFRNIIWNSSSWIFTDRPMIIFKPLEKQLFEVFVKDSKIPLEHLEILNNKKEVDQNISQYSPNRAVFYNASKRTEHAETIILKALTNFDRVFYIASQDIHKHYEDLDLLERVEKKYNMDMEKLTFIDIKKKWYQR